MYVPRPDQSMMKGAEPPVEYNPFSDMQREIIERSDAMLREIEELCELLSKPRSTREMTDSGNALKQQLRAGLIGFVFAVVIAVGVALLHDGAVDARVQQQDATTNRMVKDLLAQKRESEIKLIVQRRLDSAANRRSAIAAVAHDTLIRIVQSGEVTTAAPDTLTPGDTTAMMLLGRSDRPGVSWRIPQFVYDDHVRLIEVAQKVDSAWMAERSARLAGDSVVQDLLRQVVLADSIIKSQRAAIELRDRSRRRGILKASLYTVTVWEAGKLIVRAIAHR